VNIPHGVTLIIMLSFPKTVRAVCGSLGREEIV